MIQAFQKVFCRSGMELLPLGKDSSKEALEQALSIYKSNPAYFDLAGEKAVGLETVLEDLHSIPPGYSASGKVFGLIFQKSQAVAVVDMVLAYPDEDCCYLGLLLVKGELHSQGAGSAIFSALETAAVDLGFRRIRLGVLEENKKGEVFWQRQGFSSVKKVKNFIHPEKNGMISVLEKILCSL